MILEADLPLNKRGAVYHLDLLPEEVADTIITVGDPARVKEVSCHFDRLEVQKSHREFVTHTGYIGLKRVSVVSTGIGVPNIDIVVNELDALANINLKSRVVKPEIKQLTMIRLGTAGGIQQSCVPGDIYLTRYAVGFDTLMDYYEQDDSTTLKMLYQELNAWLAGESATFYVSEADKTLLNQFLKLGQPGLTMTCGGFYAPQGRQGRTSLRYPQLVEQLTGFMFEHLNVLNFEMETAGLYALGSVFGHRCLSLSVALANRQTGVFTENVREHMQKMILKALPIIERLDN